MVDVREQDDFSDKVPTIKKVGSTLGRRPAMPAQRRPNFLCLSRCKPGFSFVRSNWLKLKRPANGPERQCVLDAVSGRAVGHLRLEFVIFSGKRYLYLFDVNRDG